ncbi:hypothetical protein GGF50DRAFT_101951 [Schizophyllum commune]
MGVSRFIVQSSDVLQNFRVNVCPEHSEKVIWYKERYLTDDEIVENLVFNHTNTICWTVHRPKRGWYIRIRAPSFPPDVFIPLTPVPALSPYHADGALSFKSRTNIPPDAVPPLAPPIAAGDLSLSNADLGMGSFSRVDLLGAMSGEGPVGAGLGAGRLSSNLLGPHGYPPKTNPRLSQPRPESQTTEFILAPHAATEPKPTGLLARAAAALKAARPAHNNSFTLARIPTPTAPPPYQPHDPTVEAVAFPPSAAAAPPPPAPPVLRFHDTTPVLMVRRVTGVIEIDREEERFLGIEASFWIAVALTYLDFLEDRESYIAAAND